MPFATNVMLLTLSIFQASQLKKPMEKQELIINKKLQHRIWNGRMAISILVDTGTVCGTLFRGF